MRPFEFFICLFLASAIACFTSPEVDQPKYSVIKVQAPQIGEIQLSDQIEADIEVKLEDGLRY